MLRDEEGARRTPCSCAAVLAVLCTLLVSAHASADARADTDVASFAEHEPPLGEEHRTQPPHALFGELAYYTADDANSSFALVRALLGGRYVLDSTWSFTGRLPLVALDSAPNAGPGDFALRFGNPELFAWYDGLLADGTHGRAERKPLRARFGLGVSGPLASIERGATARLHRTALSNASALDAFGSVWLWAPSRSAVVGAALGQWDAHEELLLEAELWPAVLIPSREEFWREPLELFVPAVIGARTRGLVSVGPYLRAVWMPSSNVDSLQWSIEPRVRVELTSFFVEGRVTVSLGEPLAGARGPGMWAVHLAAGGSL